MIKEAEIEICGHRTNYKYYKDRGYDIQYKKSILIKIEDLMPGSTIKLTTICDKCGATNSNAYRDYYNYTKGLTIDYYCSKCSKLRLKETCIQKYGVDNPMKSDEVKNKLKKSLIQKYGVDHYSKTDEFKSKYKDTCLEKYNINNTFQLTDRIKATNLEKWGVEYPQQSLDIKLKSDNTNLEKYGFKKYSQTDEYKVKVKETSLNKWGVDNYSQTDEYKVKVKETNLEKWGVDNYSKTDEYKVKVKETNLEKWGVDHYSKTDGFKKRVKIKRESLTKLNYQNLIDKYYNIVSYLSNNFTIHHTLCNSDFNINRDVLYSRINLGICLCTNCYPVEIQQSYMEIEMQNFLNETGVTYIVKDKSILNGKEIDIYLPDHKIAIEMNGVYWHSDIYVDKNYHLNKTLLCKDRGIQLLHIWEDDWKYKRNIVKSIILNKINHINNRIFARKCEIRNVSILDSRNFLNSNHIQGYASSQVKVGLYYNQELVSLMTFGCRYTNGRKEYELIRFCNKINTNIVGGSSKLFNFFIKNNSVDKLVSYCDISLFNGNLYKTLGFIKSHLSSPNYYWIVDGVKKHRFNYNKKKLVKMGHDPLKSENDIMYELGYYKVWGCGQEKYIYEKV